MDATEPRQGRRGHPSANYVIQDNTKAPLGLLRVKIVIQDNTKTKRGKLHAQAADRGNMQVRLDLVHVPIVKKEDTKI